MEFPALEDKCTQKDRRQLDDFLPAKCTHTDCNAVNCSEHLSPFVLESDIEEEEEETDPVKNAVVNTDNEDEDPDELTPGEMLDMELFDVDGVEAVGDGTGKDDALDDSDDEEDSTNAKASGDTTSGQRQSENLKQLLKTVQLLIQRVMKERDQITKAYMHFDAAEHDLFKELMEYRNILKYNRVLATDKMNPEEWAKFYEKYFVNYDFPVTEPDMGPD